MIRFRPIPSPISLLAAVLAFVSISIPLQADDVYLTNGRVFEDVVAERRGDDVAIALSYGGEIVLSGSQIVRIEGGRVSFQDFRDRERALLRQRDATAQDWLELALWARDQDYDPGVRRAALRASRHNPNLPGLKPVLSELGMVRASKGGDWVTPNERNRRLGLVSSNGEWISRQEAERRAHESQQRAADARRERILDRLTEIEVQRQILETARRANPAPVAVPTYAPTAGSVIVGRGHYTYGAPQHGPPQGGGHQHGPECPEHAIPNVKPPAERNYGRSERIIPGRLNPGVSSPPGSLGNSRP